MTFYEWIYDKYKINIRNEYQLGEEFTSQEIFMMKEYYNEGNIPKGGDYN